MAPVLCKQGLLPETPKLDYFVSACRDQVVLVIAQGHACNFTMMAYHFVPQLEVLVISERLHRLVFNLVIILVFLIFVFNNLRQYVLVVGKVFLPPVYSSLINKSKAPLANNLTTLETQHDYIALLRKRGLKIPDLQQLRYEPRWRVEGVLLIQVLDLVLHVHVNIGEGLVQAHQVLIIWIYYTWDWLDFGFAFINSRLERLENGAQQLFLVVVIVLPLAPLAFLGEYDGAFSQLIQFEKAAKQFKKQKVFCLVALIEGAVS